MKKYKATAISPANIAFIKYWGWQNKKDQKLILPANDSISMNLSNCLTTTTVEFSQLFKKDTIKIKFFSSQEKIATKKQQERILDQVNRFREMKKIYHPVKIVSQNTFPADVGIASSASAFSALTLALSKALGFVWDKKRFSIEARLSGSGSACRSVIDGFVYWQKDQKSENCYAYQLKDENWWKLVDIVVVLKSDNPKEKSSLQGHSLASTSPYYQVRLKNLPKRIQKIKEAILEKDFKKLGSMIEQDTISMHTVCMTCDPAIFYWNQGTFEIMQSVRNWRKNGLESYFTIDAGHNVHVICQEKDAKKLNEQIKKLTNVSFTIINRPCKGARLIDEHLF